MYVIKSYQVKDIPVLELVDAGQADQALQLVIFYHGWSNSKEQSLTHGYELAKQSFRVILPDSLRHGDRFEKDGEFSKDVILRIIAKNIQEYPHLIRNYQDRGLIKDNFIGVTGLSMGGITASMLITRYSNISAGAVLMGASEFVEYGQAVVDEIEERRPEEVTDNQAALAKQLMKAFSPVDLSRHPEKLAGRPLFFWHSVNDDVVPYQYSKDFADKVHNTKEGKNIHYMTSDDGGHHVPYHVSYIEAVFFRAAYESQDILPTMKWAMIEKFGVKSEEFFNYHFDY